MDINLLVIAVGNSRLHLGTFVAGELKQVRHVPHSQESDFGAIISELWADLGSGAEVAGCSVVSTLEKKISDLVLATTGQSVQWVGRDLDLPMTVQTKEPKKTGADRILAAAAAYEQLEKACVVVDAGTAITINLVNDSGAFVGGSIAPGLSTMLDSLHEKTTALPRVQYQQPASSFGDDTESAIRHGITDAIRGVVQSAAERWAEQCGIWPEVIATGGDAHLLFDGWEVVHAVSPDLLLYGIALAYTNHHIKGSS
jgi:type III pantothenate kinase